MTTFTGLSEAEAKLLLGTHGPNELPTSQRASFAKLLIRVVTEPMIVLLLACIGIYFAIGEISDTVLLSLSVLFVISINLYQDIKSSRALEALRNLSSPRALVVRSGVEKKIPSRELVPGDLIILNEGDRVPADAEVLEQTNLELDESLLTGESIPVAKEVGDQVFSSTLTTSGFARARVKATGQNTEVGKIGKVLFTNEEQPTRLQTEVRQLIRRFGVASIVFSFAIVVAHVIRWHDWTQGILAGLATSLALLPEEFPVVMTVFIALGAWRMSRLNVLVRNPSATENLGAITVLCVDKTGTLTENKMTVSTFVPIDSSGEELKAIARLACRPGSVDPMDKAILVATADANLSLKLIKEYSLSRTFAAMTMVWRSQKNEFVFACKGAPEKLAGLSLNKVRNEEFLSKAAELSSQGFRVLGVGRGINESLPTTQQELTLELMGLIAVEDPVRKEAIGSVSECRSAGIRVIMMTGDHPKTAIKIAEQVGLSTSNVLTGTEISELNDQELEIKLKETNVFARVVPDQKLRIVKALQSLGEVVAMTGDGVNDGPSLQAADVGIAMGGRGTDVAREASDIVIVDDNFSSIVAGIKQGRRIFHNIKRAMGYIFAIHVPIAGLAMLPVIFGLPLIFFPAHIVFLELIIDPACTLVYEGEPDDENAMRVPPRNLRDPLFSLKNIIVSSTEGFLILCFTLLFFVLALYLKVPAEQSRAMLFSAFVLCNLGLIVIHSGKIRNLNNNNAFRWVVGLALIALSSSLYIPYMKKVFGFQTLTVTQIIAVLAVAAIATSTSKILKEAFK